MTDGPNAWSWDGPWEPEWWKQPHYDDGNMATEDAGKSNHHDAVRDSLAKRQPSSLTVDDQGGADSTPSPTSGPSGSDDLCPADELPRGDDEPEGAVEAPAPQNPDDAWKCDKHGNPLKPEALRMRFLRRIRSRMA